MQKTSQTPFEHSETINTAVLFLIFNRLDTTKQVFEAIRLAKPPRLYIAADGPRDSRQDEDKKVKAVRNYVMDHVDWNCEVKTLFREKNLGCKYAVSGGIDWFFENEEMGIILEDDCLPCQSFFWFCEELLNKYKYDERVWQICGSDFVGTILHLSQRASYRFSKYGPIWGWASWRRAWIYYDPELKRWPVMCESGFLESAYDSVGERKARVDLGQRLFSGEIDTWDYQWQFTKNYQSGLSIIPVFNLILNVGFGVDSTHTTGVNPHAPKITHELRFPLTHPEFLLADRQHDRVYRSKFIIHSDLATIKKTIKLILQLVMLKIKLK